MRASLLLGLELPPVPAADAAKTGAGPARRPEEQEPARPLPDGLFAFPVSLEPWWRMAEAGLTAGAGTLWFADGPADGVSGSGGWCDPSTLVGGVATRWPLAHMGVVSSLPGGRHPSVVAREISTLDVLSGGRAAVQMRWPTPPPADPAAACDLLTDAVAVCVAMLRGGDPVYDGRAFRISAAVNVPAPRQAAGVPVLVAPPPEVAAELAAAGRRQHAARARVRALVALADAVVCGADPRALAAWRAVLDDLEVEDASVVAPAGRDSTGRLRAGAGMGARRPALVCSVPADLAGGMEPRRMAARGRDAGADGVILSLSSGPAGAPIPGGIALDGAATGLVEVASEVYALWRRPAI